MDATVLSQPAPTNSIETIKLHSKGIATMSLALIAASCAIVPWATGWMMQACFALALLVASWIDTKTRLIPNRLTYPLLLIGLVGNALVSMLGVDRSWNAIGIEESLQGAGVCFALMLFLFFIGSTGGGDVKLAAAIGAFLGPQAGLTSIAWCHILAGAVAILWAVGQLNYFCIVNRLRRYTIDCWVAQRLLPFSGDFGSLGKKRIPMAAFFALGVLITQLGFRLW